MEPTNVSPTSPSIALVASAERVPSGHSLSLEWKVTGQAASGVQLASAGEAGLEMIEAVPHQGARQVVLARPGVFTFTLTVTLRAGGQRCKQVRVRVDG